jgi:hypothetical protein
LDRKITLGLTLLATATILTNHAQASTGLINFPIADILKHREGVYSLGASGFARNVNKGYSWAHTATFGILDRGEIGVSNDFLGNTVYDAKVQLYDSEKQGVSLSIGVNRYDANARTADTFVSFRKNFTAFRFHASAYKSGSVVGVFGVDFGCGHILGCGEWSVAVEHMTGPASETWAALNSPVFADHFSMTFATRAPWDGGAGPQYQAVLNYGFRF